jgi:hypothetical protein
MADLHFAERINATAKLQLIDITGRTFFVENAVINNGYCKRKFRFLLRFSSGIYTVEIIPNGKSYFSKLMYAKIRLVLFRKTLSL